MYSIFELSIILINFLILFLFAIATASLTENIFCKLFEKETKKRKQQETIRHQRIVYVMCENATSGIKQEFIGQRKCYINELIKFF